MSETRPQISLTLVSGTGYDANHIAIVKAEGSGFRIVFESSGLQYSVNPEDVARIDISAEGATWCPWCDGRISQ